MHNSKLIKVLRKLSKRQLGHFEDFVQSPYFNKNTEIIALYKYLLPFGPAFTHKKLQKETVFKSLSKNKNESPKRLPIWMNGLFKLLETFLSIEQINEDQWQKDYNLVYKYLDLNLSNDAKKRLEKTFQKLNSLGHNKVDFFKVNYTFSKFAYSLSNKNKWAFNNELKKADDALNKYFIIEKLRFCCVMLNVQNILNIQFDLSFSESILDNLKEQTFLKIPAIAVYFSIYKLLKEQDDQTHFQNAKNLLTQYSGKFNNEELLDLYSSILNYCTLRINHFNDEHYWLEYLEINKVLLSKDLLLEEGQLSPWRYTNLVNVGLKTGQIDWTKNFLIQYKNVLPEGYQQNMFDYNSAALFYYLKKYDKAQQLIVNLETKDLRLNIINRSLLIKIYFETDQTELLLFSLEASRIFLLRNKLIDPKMKSQMKNFVEYTRKLAKIDQVDAHKLAPLKESLPEPTTIMHHEWLIRQTNKKMEELL